jgi:NADP-dependent 3-hydroxy acid dehydrogenase YdfG
VYCATKAAVKALSDGLRIDLVDTPLRVTNIKPGMVETNFSVVRFRGDKGAADRFYQGIHALSGDDVAKRFIMQLLLPTCANSRSLANAYQSGYLNSFV